MTSITNFLATTLGPLINAGPLVMIFIIFTLAGILVRLGLFRSLRSGLLIAIGFQGVYLLIDFFLGKIGPVAGQLASRFGSAFAYTDIGWTPFAGIAWGSPIALLVVGISIAVNLVMILLNMTDTINLNLWDTWMASLGAMLVIQLTQSLWAGIAFAVMFLWVSLILVDWFSNQGFVAYYGFSDLSFYQGTNTLNAFVGIALAKILNRLPRMKPSFLASDQARSWLGVIGDPAILGGLIGFLLGLAARLPWIELIMFTIEVAAALVLLPKMTEVVMQAILPVSEAAAKTMRERVEGRKLYVGVDPALAVGNTTALTTTMLLLPALLVLCLALPFAKAIPIADALALVYQIVFIVPVFKGDLLRCLIGSLALGVIAIFISSYNVVLLTKLAASNGIAIPMGTAGVTSWILHFSSEIFIGGIIGANYHTLGAWGVTLIAAAVIGITVVYRLNFLKKRRNGEVRVYFEPLGENNE